MLKSLRFWHRDALRPSCGSPKITRIHFEPLKYLQNTLPMTEKHLYIVPKDASKHLDEEKNRRAYSKTLRIIPGAQRSAHNTFSHYS